jgi:hypothetical protein
MSRHSDLMTERWKDPVERAKIAKGMSEAAKKRWADPKKRKLLLAVLKAARLTNPYVPPKVIRDELAEIGVTYQQLRALPLKRRQRVMARLRQARKDPSRRDEHFALAREWASSKPPSLFTAIKYKRGPNRKKMEPRCTPATEELLRQYSIKTSTYVALPPTSRGELVYRLRGLASSPQRRDIHMAVISRILKDAK